MGLTKDHLTQLLEPGTLHCALTPRTKQCQAFPLQRKRLLREGYSQPFVLAHRRETPMLATFRLCSGTRRGRNQWQEELYVALYRNSAHSRSLQEIQNAQCAREQRYVRASSASCACKRIRILSFSGLLRSREKRSRPRYSLLSKGRWHTTCTSQYSHVHVTTK